MNISEIKAELGVETLNMNMGVSQDEAKTPTGWYRQWDNDNRVSIVMHEETYEKVKAGHSNLGIKEEAKTAAKGPYTLKTIVAYEEADITL